MSEQKYIGITIGPIYKTLSKAEKTREIWGGSYLISYLCRKLVDNLQIPDIDILIPVKADSDVLKPGVGLYPDRIVFKAGYHTIQTVNTAIIETKNVVVAEILDAIDKYKAYDPYARLYKDEVNTDARKETARKHLFDYLQVYAIYCTNADLQLKNSKGEGLGVVKCLNFYLDNLELRQSITGFDPDPMKVFLRGINHSFLLKDAFAPGFKHFPSLIEIATTELRFISKGGRFLFRQQYDAAENNSFEEAKKEERATTTREKIRDKDDEGDSNENESEDNLLDILFSIDGVENEVRTYHKYVAIIHADGDRMGNLIGNIKTEGVPEFSNNLMRFAIEANKIIAGKRFTENEKNDWGYGGAPVYIGGDDLVFFAPVASRIEEDGIQKFKTVFHLISEIDKKFNEIFNAKDNSGNYIRYPAIPVDDRPCLSYGVSFTYLKYPLLEAFEQSRKFMLYVKNDNFKNRNRLNFQIQKHSGQYFGGVIDKNHPYILDSFLSLMDENNNSSLKEKKSEQFINSITQKLQQYETTIIACADEPQRIQDFFDNVFNEKIHDDYRTYLNSICNLLQSALLKYPEDISKSKKERQQEALKTIHGMLRFIHFIRDNEFRN